MPIREVLSIRGLDKKSTAFLREMIAVADRRDLDPSYFAAVMAFESGLDPTAVNPSTNATGLIQFMPSTAKLLGTSVEELLQMTDVEQLFYVEDAYSRVDPAKKIQSIEDHYLAVFSPKWLFRPSSTVMYSIPAGGCEGSKSAYCLNRGLDQDKDGSITKREAAHRVRQLVREAEGKPPILVDTGGGPVPLPGPPPVPLKAGMGGQQAFLFGAAAFLAYQGVKRYKNR